MVTTNLAGLAEVTDANPPKKGCSAAGVRPSRGLWVFAVLLWVIAAWSFLWPASRAFLNVEIDTNEGWNAYLADAAMGRVPLYPSADQLVTNNYPPVSFYIVGALGKLFGDPLLAGRLLSLAAVLAIAAAIASSVRQLGGSRSGAAIGAAFFVVTLSRFAERYVGMDDPQLLAQAVMAWGFVGFLRARARDRGYIGPILLMGLAGFIKHNIIAMPLTAFVWLAAHRPRECAKCAAAAAVAVALGFAACFAAYGRDFLMNMMSARQYSWERVFSPAVTLKCLDVGLAVSIFLCWAKRRDSHVQLCGLLIGFGLGAYLLQKIGAGVDVNMQFDLMIGISIGVALAFTHAARLAPGRFFLPEAVQIVLILALCVRLLPWKRFESMGSFRLLFDPAFRTEIAIREQAMADSVARVQATPGGVMSSNFVCYRAGKPLAVDKFNTSQRMLTGALPRDAIQSRINSGEVTEVTPDPRADWDRPLTARRPPY